MIHLPSIIEVIIGFLVAWIIASIPVWLASKLFSNESSFPRAMAATLLSIIVFAVIVFIFAFISAIIGIPILSLLGIVLGFIGVLAVYKALFDVGWLGALGIAFVAFIISIIISLILAALGLGAFTLTHFLHIKT
ncbi:MAG: hypothetical protein RXQ80_07235 [Sulfolobaceae archaeon]|jgi:uncharacterized membrane protein|nr:hypothetical protein [Sulfolobaceae archaeon]